MSSFLKVSNGEIILYGTVVKCLVCFLYFTTRQNLWSYMTCLVLKTKILEFLRLHVLDKCFWLQRLYFQKRDAFLIKAGAIQLIGYSAVQDRHYYFFAPQLSARLLLNYSKCFRFSLKKCHFGTRCTFFL